MVAAGCSGSQPDDPEPSNGNEEKRSQPPGSPPLDPSGEWPFPRYDAGNTGSNPDGRGLRDGTQYWRFDEGEAPVFANGTLYNTSDGSVLYRDPATAVIETRTKSRDAISESRPVVADGKVFANISSKSDAGLTILETFCFDATTGEQQWKRPIELYSGSLLVHDGIVVTNNDSFVWAFNADSGEELWEFDLNYDTSRYSGMAVGDGKVFVSSSAGLHAIELISGEEAYTVERDLDSGGTLRRSTPVVNDQMIYVKNSDEELVAFDTQDGTIHWRTPTSGFDGQPIVTDDVVYVCTETELRVVDSKDGSIINSYPPIIRRPMGLVGDVLYGTAQQSSGRKLGTLHALDVANDFESLWTLRTDGKTVEDDGNPANIRSITPVNSAVYVSAVDGFYGIGPKTSEQ